MGRAHEVRAASMAKTNLMKSKLYSKYGKLIYMEAKNGGTDPNANLKLRALIDKAKKDQVPADVIKRNIEKANGGTGENYSSCRYEAYGPSGSTFIIECLSDNSNRTLSSLNIATQKCGAHLGKPGSVSYNYDYVGVLDLTGLDEDSVLEVVAEAGIDVLDLYSNEDGSVTVTANPSDLSQVRQALEAASSEVSFQRDEVAWVAKEEVSVPKEDFDKLIRFMNMLAENDDVTNVYHNVSNMPEEE